MNHDSEHRRFRFIEANDTTEFSEVTAGWLELAESIVPGTPKAILEGDYLVYLPDNTRFIEVSYKTEHAAINLALVTWCRSAGRRVARVDGRELVLNDGRQFRLDQVRFDRLK